jgi:hypothetical protein
MYVCRLCPAIRCVGLWAESEVKKLGYMTTSTSSKDVRKELNKMVLEITSRAEDLSTARTIDLARTAVEQISAQNAFAGPCENASMTPFGTNACTRSLLVGQKYKMRWTSLVPRPHRENSSACVTKAQRGYQDQDFKFSRSELRGFPYAESLLAT